MTGPRIVVLGMLSKIPVAGVVWQTVHYLLGFQRLGYDVVYAETHARTPSMFMETEHDDAHGKAAAFVAQVMGRFGFGNSWAYHALDAGGRCYGMSERELSRAYDSAEVIVNLHGGTVATDELAATGRLVYLETDPVQVQLELAADDAEVIEYLEPHCAFFTFAENYGREDCLLPTSARLQFYPTRQPVVLDLWETQTPPGAAYTTVGQWRQDWRDVEFGGDVYRWSKHHEFHKVLDLPARTGSRFELVLDSLDAEARDLLDDNGWMVRDAKPLSDDIDAYRSFLQGSRGEFTVAKDQNVRLRTGWFSDRSATYLAAGRPVVTQDTGFGTVLPTGLGLMPFTTVGEAQEAIEAIERDYARHAEAARDIAREFFAAERVLADLLATVDVRRPAVAAVAE